MLDFKSALSYRDERPAVSGFIGVDDYGVLTHFELNETQPHVIIGGQTGAGKTTVLYDLLMSALVNTTPDKLQLVLIDGKGNSFEVMKGLPFMLQDPVDGSANHNTASFIILAMSLTLKLRQKRLRTQHMSSLSEYNKIAIEKLPEILIVVDELSAITHMIKDKTEHRQLVDNLVTIAKYGRQVGLHLIISNQNVTGRYGLPKELLSTIPDYIGMRTASQGDSDKLTRNSKYANLEQMTKPGQFYYHGRQGQALAFKDEDVRDVVDDIRRHYTN